MVVQPCEYTKNYQIVHLKRVNFMVNYISTTRINEEWKKQNKQVNETD